MSISERIKAICHENPDAGSEDLAARLVEELGQDEIVAMIAQDIDTYRRNQVRTIEKTAFSQFFDVDRRIDTSPETIARLRDVFAEKFSLGKGLDVEWGKATVDQHRMRIAMLMKLRDGINQTIDRHERAIEIIESAGVTCLDEVARAA